MASTTQHYLTGRRVEIPTHLDAWMAGDRYGTVERVTRAGVAHIRMDRSQRVLTVSARTLEDYGRTLD